MASNTLDASQADANARAVEAVRGFLGGPRRADDGWRFEFAEHLESNWGAVFGGALAAGVLAVARAVAPERSPRALHLQIVRSVPRGEAFATAVMRHDGRTVGTVEVDLHDERGKLAVIALVTMVTPEAVAGVHHDTSAPPFQIGMIPISAEESAFFAPITRELKMDTEQDGVSTRLVIENVRPSHGGIVADGLQCTIPWDDLAHTGPESACLLADAVIGAPVLRSFIPMDALGPNADLSLRFSTAPATRVVVAAGSMLSVQHGTATVGIEVRAGKHQLADGLATSLLLPPR